MQPSGPPHQADKPPDQIKNIMVFCDGTGKDGASAKGQEEPTNVWQLYQLMKQAYPRPSAEEGVGDHILYLSGVGSGSAKNPVNLLGRIFGVGIVNIVVEAYLYIATRYQQGDRICLFGYSRGAFVARKVASLIFRIGLVPGRDRFLELWQQQEKPIPWKTSVRTESNIPIQYLAVWDTVGAIYSKHISKMHGDILGMPDEELPLNVVNAFHIVAFHENRRLFLVSLFKPNGVTQLKEVWFPGAHSDVGGGGSKFTELPRLSLIWLIGEIGDILRIPHDQIEYPSLRKLNPTNAYRDSPAWKRLVDRCQTRLQSKVLTPRSRVHETVVGIKKVQDLRPDSSLRMLSIDDLRVINWNLSTCLVSCNALETYKRGGILQGEGARTPHETESLETESLETKSIEIDAFETQALANLEAARHTTAWDRYTNQWELLKRTSTKAGENIEVASFRFRDIPWPMVTCPASPTTITKEEVKNFLFSPYSRQEKPPRMLIMEILKTWHPDKFFRHWMQLNLVVETDREDVNEGVLAVARAANELLAEVSTSTEREIIVN
ncbi:hypothetical protein BDV93DRAFT_500451 [Ceratobasidium sp. AG-I]|nr:hypothetical protein BDV93DRAFT_500451 [Ceratobasidium sp. AG-I]